MLPMQGIIWMTGSVAKKISHQRHLGRKIWREQIQRSVFSGCYKAIQWRWISNVSVVPQIKALAADPNILYVHQSSSDRQKQTEVFSEREAEILSRNTWNPPSLSEREEVKSFSLCLWRVERLNGWGRFLFFFLGGRFLRPPNLAFPRERRGMRWEKMPLVTACRVVSSKSASGFIPRMLCKSCERRVATI